METLLKYIAILPLIGAAFAFFWGVIQFLVNREMAQDEAQFNRFQEIIRKIQYEIQDGKHTSPYIEIQIAAIYELRFLEKYHPAAEIYLKQKKTEWQMLSGKYQSLGVPIIDSTLSYIVKGTWKTRLKRSFLSFYKDSSFI